MKIHEIIAESARTNRVQLSESQINEIAEIFGNDLTEEQLNEIAGGDYIKKLIAGAAIAAATMLSSGAAHADVNTSPNAQQAIVAQKQGEVVKVQNNDTKRFETIAAKLNQQRSISQTYTINVGNQGSPAEVKVFKNAPGQVAGVGPNARYVTGVSNLVCEIQVNAKYFQNLSDDAVAWVLGHEMAHCELKHGDPAVKSILNKTTQNNWDQEYDADILGAKLARAAGFNPEAAFKEMNMLKQRNAEGKYSHTHPDYDARMSNLQGGKRHQISPIKVDKDREATQLKHTPDGRVTLG